MEPCATFYVQLIRINYFDAISMLGQIYAIFMFSFL